VASDIGILGDVPSAMRSSEAAAFESRAARGGFFGWPDDMGEILPAKALHNGLHRWRPEHRCLSERS